MRADDARTLPPRRGGAKSFSRVRIRNATGCGVIEAETREAPVSEPPEDPPPPGRERARARAYLDLFERHVLRAALGRPARDGSVIERR